MDKERAEKRLAELLKQEEALKKKLADLEVRPLPQPSQRCRASYRE
jgi:hypothetical protein